MNYAKSNYLVKLSGIGTTLFLITGDTSDGVFTIGHIACIMYSARIKLDYFRLLYYSVKS